MVAEFMDARVGGIDIATAFPGTSSSVAIVCQEESLCVRGSGESSEVEWLTTR